MSTERVTLISQNFYSEYHGHRIEDLKVALQGLKNSHDPPRGVIYLAGDSSLDNKFWFRDSARAVNGYSGFLELVPFLRVYFVLSRQL
jgi:hypothetical protein